MDSGPISLGFHWLSVKLGIAALCGIGFAMSLFIGLLAFTAVHC